MMLQFSCILVFVAAWAFKVWVLGMLYLNMAIPHIRIFEGLVASCALYWNVVVPVAMLLPLRFSPERIHVAEVALELLPMRLGLGELSWTWASHRTAHRQKFCRP